MKPQLKRFAKCDHTCLTAFGQVQLLPMQYDGCKYKLPAKKLYQQLEQVLQYLSLPLDEATK